MSSDRIDTSVFSDGSGPGLSVRPDARPWPRFWARLFDLALWSIVLAFPLGLLLGLTMPWIFEDPVMAGPVGTAIFGLMLVPLSLLADAFIVAIFGNSVGKAIAGIRPEPREGGSLTVGRLIRRNANLYVFGLALGVPLLNLAAYIVGYNKLSNGQRTAWDKLAETRVVSTGSSLGRTWVTAVLYYILAVIDRVIGAL